MPFGGIADGLCGQIKRGYPSERMDKPWKTILDGLPWLDHTYPLFTHTPPWKTANSDLAINNKQNLHSKRKPFILCFQITNALS